MTYHGSWNRSVPTGAKVVRVHVQNGRPVSVEDFVTGWQLADGSRWGRPVGLLVMPDGALLVSDDDGSRIWRVSSSQAASPTTGNLTVTTSTSGSNIPASYTLNASGPSGSTSQPIGANTSVTFSAIIPGDYTVSLSGVAANCTVSGANPRTVTVPSGGTGSTTFSVSCTASSTTGNPTVTTSTTGSSQPSGYTVTVDGSQSQTIGAKISVTFSNLAAGSHSVALTNVPGNCSVNGGPSRTATAPSGGTTTVAYSVSCTTPSTTGNLTVATSTTGSSMPASYTLSASGPGGSTSQAIGANTSVTFSAITAGDYTVSLSNVPANCTLSGANPRTVTVPAGGTGSTTFSVSCTTPSTTGNLTVTTSTTGSSLPSGYTVTVDGSQSQAIGANSSVTFSNLAAGSHSVALTNVAGNCSVSGGPSRTATVPSGGATTVAYSVSCTTPPGSLTVTTSTTGSSLPSGYTVTVDGSQSQAIGANSSVTFSNLAAGSHSVALTNVAGNCAVSGGTSRTATVPSGGTATVAYSVSCTTPPRSPNLTTTTTAPR